MVDIKKSKHITALAAMVLLMSPAICHSRVNSLIGGVSVGLDYDDRRNDTVDKYRRLILSPQIQFRSLSEKDSFRLRLAPSIKYDLEDSGTDWDSNLNVSADRFMTKSWQMGVSNTFLRSDYNNSSNRDINPIVTADNTVVTDPKTGEIEVLPSTTEPQLSSDRGRRRYWRNTLGIYSNLFYHEGSLLRMDANYIALRNDNNNNNFSGGQDYDRYTAGLRDEHRFNAKWKSKVEGRYVRGIFDSSNNSSTSSSVDNVLSDNLQEYHLGLGLENDSIANNPLSANYNYIATRYDDNTDNDNDIHQARFTWRRDYSPRLYTKIGGGPSYEKTKGQDATWTTNGLAEVNYLVEHGFANFRVERKYDVDNFSGSGQRGAVKSWETRLAGGYQLQKDLSLSGRLSYINEDRQETVNTSPGGTTSDIRDFNRKRYIAGTILSYTFWQYYNASIDYTFTKQDSELAGDSYNDHRVLLTISWMREMLRW